MKLPSDVRRVGPLCLACLSSSPWASDLLSSPIPPPYSLIMPPTPVTPPRTDSPSPVSSSPPQSSSPSLVDSPSSSSARLALPSPSHECDSWGDQPDSTSSPATLSPSRCPTPASTKPNTTSSSRRIKPPHPGTLHRRASSTHRVRETLNAKSVEMDDGRRTVNQYKLGPELGKGAFGKVELGVDVQTGEQYAIKEYSKSRLRRQVHQRSMADARNSSRGRGRGGGRGGNVTASSEGRVGERNRDEAGNPLALIAREMAIMKKLDHPNLIHLYEVLDVPDQDSLFMVLEYCPGGILMDLPPLVPNTSSDGDSPFPTPLREPMNVLTSKVYFSQILMGLEYLHENSVVHQDLKPENILLSGDGKTVKLCDFGVSEMFKKRGDDRVRKGMGSPAFMSPESLGDGREIHAKAADIWALGITLYCMRSGFLPFRQDNPLDLYEAIKHEPIKFPPQWTGAGKNLLERMLERDPEKRITIDDIRDHPWLSDIDMPSKETNLAEERMVREPSESEINSAIRSITSAFAVIRAVQKFKRLASQARSQGSSSRQSTFDSAVSMTSESPPISRPSTPSSSYERHSPPSFSTTTNPGGQSHSEEEEGEEEGGRCGGKEGSGRKGEPSVEGIADEISEEPLSMEPEEMYEEQERHVVNDDDDNDDDDDDDEGTPQPPSLAKQQKEMGSRPIAERATSSTLTPAAAAATGPTPLHHPRPGRHHPHAQGAALRPNSTSVLTTTTTTTPMDSLTFRPSLKLNLEVTSPPPSGNDDELSGQGRNEEEEEEDGEGRDLEGLGGGMSRLGMVVVESPGGGREEIG